MPKRTRPDVEQARATLRAAGLRRTGARLAVLQRLEAAHTPRSHAELVADLAGTGFDRATIYRNLIDLTQAGLVTRTDVGDHVWRFERKRATAAREEAEHPHFMCTDCGTVACLPGVRVRIKAGAGVRPSVLSRAVTIQLKGTCDRCA